MLFWLSHWLTPWLPFLRVFQFLTTRYALATLTALIISLIMGPNVIRWLQARQIGQVIRTVGPESHLSKQGTPTMGGVLIIFSLIVSILLWANPLNRYVELTLFTLCGFGLLGFYDDFQKLRQKHSKGVPPRLKYVLQSIMALAMIVTLYFTGHPTDLVIPYAKQAMITLGPGYFLLGYFVIVGASNAMNLTDGLDGLAILPALLIASGLGIFAYLEGNHSFAHYLSVPYLAGIGELGVFCSAMVGAGLGFLWFNAYPAQMFMGDVGSLSIGAALGAGAVCLRQEIVFFLMSGVFVMETVSVMLQVASFKLTGKRIFAMAPLHHHFELKGWAENQVIVRFWILGVMFVLLGLMSLKFR